MFERVSNFFSVCKDMFAQCKQMVLLQKQTSSETWVQCCKGVFEIYKRVSEQDGYAVKVRLYRVKARLNWRIRVCTTLRKQESKRVSVNELICHKRAFAAFENASEFARKACYVSTNDGLIRCDTVENERIHSFAFIPALYRQPGNRQRRYARGTNVDPETVCIKEPCSIQNLNIGFRCELNGSIK